VKYLYFIIVLIVFCGCSYSLSLKGISISPDVNTYYINAFQNRASNAPAGIETDFTDQLIQKINGNTRLTYNDDNPDIEFEGSISGFNVRAVAPQQSNDQTATTAFNRLNISVRVNYINNLDEEENWNQTFSFYEDFESTQDLNSVQDDLTQVIFTQILEDIFNKAFTNW